MILVIAGLALLVGTAFAAGFLVGRVERDDERSRQMLMAMAEADDVHRWIGSGF